MNNAVLGCSTAFFGSLFLAARPFLTSPLSYGTKNAF
jgi:hypothetical protein